MSTQTPKPTRRQFIQTAVSTAFAVPMIVPRHCVAGSGMPAPSETVTIGMIGCGIMAFNFHFSTLLGTKDARIVAVCDVDTTRRNFAKSLVESRYSKDGQSAKCDDAVDYRAIIGRKDIDAVLIATPEHWHAIPIIEACKAGKDVYCEKPLTLTLLEGKRCIEAVRKHKRVFQTGSQQRSNVFGDFRQAVEFLRSGRIGTIKSVTVGVGGPSKWCDLPGEPMEPGLDWNMWLGAAPMRPYSSILSPRGKHNHFPAWRNYREYAGGAHSDMGAHHYDIAQWALGMDESGPVEIIPPDDAKAETGVRYRYANGVEMTHGGPSGCVFTSTNGTLHIDRGELTSNPADAVKEPLSAKEVHLPVSPGHHRNWLDCIKSREKCIADVEIGARTVAVVQLGNLAYWNHETIKWDPKAWNFAPHSGNPKWLDRERRLALPKA
ncbi:MAG: Gfo/Idh/MocA family oxidoreductase [Chthonomonadales bacterium]